MSLEKESNRLSVHDFFSNPIQNQTAIKYRVNEENANYEGIDVNLSKYMSEKSISEMIKVNSEIVRILKGFKIPIKINMKILYNLARNHLPHTRKIALGIANNLPEKLQSSINPKALMEATSLHDFAKVIIPENILNKNGALNPAEREIMEQHAILSYELLKTTDLDKETLNLIKNHHHDEIDSDINLQILSIADIYSALREKRSYKKEMTREESLMVIHKEVMQGKFSHDIYEALVKYANQEEKSAQFKPQRQVVYNNFVDSFSS